MININIIRQKLLRSMTQQAINQNNQCFSSFAPILHANGYHPIPLEGKKPKENSWQHRASKSTIERWCKQYPNANIGILTGVVVVVDLDIDDPSLCRQAEDICFVILGK